MQENSESQLLLACSTSISEDSSASPGDPEGSGSPDGGRARKSDKHPTTVTFCLLCDSKGHFHLVTGCHYPVLRPSSHLSARNISCFFLTIAAVWKELLVAAEQVSLCCQEDAGEGRGGKLSLLYAQEGPWLLPSLA